MEPNWCQNASNCIKPASDELLLAVLYQIWYSEQPYHALLDQEKWKSVWNREVFVNQLDLLGAGLAQRNHQSLWNRVFSREWVHSSSGGCYRSVIRWITPFPSQNSSSWWNFCWFPAGMNADQFGEYCVLSLNSRPENGLSVPIALDWPWTKLNEEFWVFLGQSPWDFMFVLRPAPNRSSSQ